MFGTAYLLWIVDGAVHFLASIASSIIWLVITTVLWVSARTSDTSTRIDKVVLLQAAAAGMMHSTRAGGDCNWISDSSGFVNSSSPCSQPQDLSSVASCRETLTVEAVGWVEFGLCTLTLLATAMWLRASKRSYVSESRRLA